MGKTSPEQGNIWRWIRHAHRPEGAVRPDDRPHVATTYRQIAPAKTRVTLHRPSPCQVESQGNSHLLRTCEFFNSAKSTWTVIRRRPNTSTPRLGLKPSNLLRARPLAKEGTKPTARSLATNGARLRRPPTPPHFAALRRLHDRALRGPRRDQKTTRRARAVQKNLHQARSRTQPVVRLVGKIAFRAAG